MMALSCHALAVPMGNVCHLRSNRPRIRTVLPRAYVDDAYSIHCRGVQPLDSPAALLAAVDKEMRQHCADIGGVARAKCEGLHSWLQAKWQAIEASGDMIAFERLQEMVRELVLVGDTEGMLAALAAHRHAEERGARTFLAHKSATQQPAPHHDAAASKGSSSGGSSDNNNNNDDSEPDEDDVAREAELSPQRRAQLTELFNTLDRKGTGSITRMAFEGALHTLGDDLNEQERENICCVLELSDSVTLEEFLDAVEEVECERVREKAASETPLRSTDIPFLRAVKNTRSSHSKLPTASRDWL